MPQLLFAQNFNHLPGDNNIRITNGTINYFPFQINDSISFLTMNIPVTNSNANMTHTFSVGLYSISGSSLSLANSISGSLSRSNNQGSYFSMTATSVAQNITPGTWYFGFLVSTGGNSVFDLIGQKTVNAANAFSNGFIGGVMTVSTNALPSSYATSDLNTTGLTAMNVPYIILSS